MVGKSGYSTLSQSRQSPIWCRLPERIGHSLFGACRFCGKRRARASSHSPPTSVSENRSSPKTTSVFLSRRVSMPHRAWILLNSRSRSSPPAMPSRPRRSRARSTNSIRVARGSSQLSCAKRVNVCSNDSRRAIVFSCLEIPIGNHRSWGLPPIRSWGIGAVSCVCGDATPKVASKAHAVPMERLASLIFSRTRGERSWRAAGTK